MKKILLVCASALLVAACGKKEDENKEPRLSLSEKKISLYKDATHTLSAIAANLGNTQQMSWTSDNGYVAGVDQTGKVTANYVGTATVSVSAGGLKADCEVTVAPQFKLFTEPVIDFGASQASIKSRERRLLSEQKEGYILYAENSELVNYVKYLFEDDRMTGVIVHLRMSASITLNQFLSERYPYYGPSGDYLAWVNDEVIVGYNPSAIELTINYRPAEQGLF